MLRDGLYEQLINNITDAEIKSSGKYADRRSVDPEEAAGVLARYRNKTGKLVVG